MAAGLSILWERSDRFSRPSVLNHPLGGHQPSEVKEYRYCRFLVATGAGAVGSALYSAASFKSMAELRRADARTPFLRFVPQKQLECRLRPHADACKCQRKAEFGP